VEEYSIKFVLFGPPKLSVQWVPKGLSETDLNMTTLLYLMPKQGIRGAIPPLPIRLHGVVFKLLHEKLNFYNYVSVFN
jgi:hypothetical protein